MRFLIDRMVCYHMIDRESINRVFSCAVFTKEYTLYIQANKQLLYLCNVRFHPFYNNSFII